MAGVLLLVPPISLRVPRITISHLKYYRTLISDLISTNLERLLTVEIAAFLISYGSVSCRHRCVQQHYSAKASIYSLWMVFQYTQIAKEQLN